jgi:hypothetical protein
VTVDGCRIMKTKMREAMIVKINGSFIYVIISLCDINFMVYLFFIECFVCLAISIFVMSIMTITKTTMMKDKNIHICSNHSKTRHILVDMIMQFQVTYLSIQI